MALIFSMDTSNWPKSHILENVSVYLAWKWRLTKNSSNRVQGCPWHGTVKCSLHGPDTYANLAWINKLICSSQPWSRARDSPVMGQKISTPWTCSLDHDDSVLKTESISSRLNKYIMNSSLNYYRKKVRGKDRGTNRPTFTNKGTTCIKQSFL